MKYHDAMPGASGSEGHELNLVRQPVVRREEIKTNVHDIASKRIGARPLPCQRRIQYIPLPSASF